MRFLCTTLYKEINEVKEELDSALAAALHFTLTSDMVDKCFQLKKTTANEWGTVIVKFLRKSDKIEIRKQVKKAIELEHVKFIQTFESKIRSDSTEFWNYIKSTKSKRSFFREMNINGTKVTYNETPNSFARYFQYTYCNLSYNLDMI